MSGEGLSYYRKKKSNKRIATDELEELCSIQERKKACNDKCEPPAMMKDNTDQEAGSSESSGAIHQTPISPPNLAFTPKEDDCIIPLHEQSEGLDISQDCKDDIQEPVEFTHTKTMKEWEALDFDLYDGFFNENLEIDEDLKEADASVYLPLLSTAFYLNEHISKITLARHLKILNIGTKSAYPALRTPYMLLSKYRHLKGDISKIFVCRMKKCSSILVMDEKGKSPAVKQPCGHLYSKKSFKDCVILQMPIEKQLKQFVERHGMFSDADPDPKIRGDVNTGAYFREMRENGLIDDKTITLQLNCDGAPAHQMSSYSIWPLMGIINEARYQLRRAYVILIALWYGEKKPPTEPYLNWAMDKLSQLQEEGFYVSGIHYRVRVVIITTDTPARPILRCTTQFNGQYGCDVCLHPGKQIKKGRGHIRIYPEVKGLCHPLRTLKQHEEDLKKVAKTKTRVNGIIGPTPLSKIPNFDFIRACIPEYMHSVCQGVIKQLIQLWTLPAYSKRDWSLTKKLKVINARIRNCTPSYEVTRTFDSLNELANWKASMYRSFALFFYVILEDQLPPAYFEHFLDLSYGLFILLQEKVSVDDVKNVEVLFRRFVIEMEKLYGEEHIKINLHFLTHLPQCVLNWGCLWAHSAFIPEWFNGQLLDLFHGTQYVATQIAENHMVKIAVREEATNLMLTSSLPHNAGSLLSELLHLPANDVNYANGVNSNDGKIELLGRWTARKATIEEEVALRNCFSKAEYAQFQSLSLDSLRFYERFQLKSTRSIFTTTQYNRAKKRVNYCALLDNGSFFEIESIVLVEISSESRAFIIGRELGTTTNLVHIPKPEEKLVFKHIRGQTAKLIGKGKTLFAHDPSTKIASKCVLSISFSIGDTMFATALPNPFETD